MTAAVAVAAASCGGTRLVGGSGGGPGTGGAPCTAATGCLNGSGGSPGGDGGRGTGGVNVALCDQLQSEYAAALPGALACTPGAPNPCQTLVALTPGLEICPTCGEYVNDANQVGAVFQRWQSACGEIVNCPSVSCIPPTPHANCIPTSPGASTGTCVPYGPDAGAKIVPDGGESCAELAADYAAAVSAARACTRGVPGQCAQSFPTTVSPCDGVCPPVVWVSGPTDAELIREKWGHQCGPSCSGDICTGSPGPWVCVPVDGGSPLGGICAPGTPPPDAGVGGAPDGGESCDQLSNDYAATLQGALTCTPGAPDQCQAEAHSEAACNGGCSFKVAVNDPNGTDTAWQRWAAQCLSGSCLQYQCDSQSAAAARRACVAVSGGSPTGGICVEVAPDSGAN